MKEMNKQPHEKIHRMRSGRVLSAGASVPVELGHVTLLACRFVHQLRSSLNSMLLGLFGGFITDMISLWPLMPMGLKVSVFKLNFGLWRPVSSCSYVGSTWRCPVMTRCSYHPGNDKRCRSSVSWTRDKDQTEKNDTHHCYNSGNP